MESPPANNKEKSTLKTPNDMRRTLALVGFHAFPGWMGLASTPEKPTNKNASTRPSKQIAKGALEVFYGPLVKPAN